MQFKEVKAAKIRVKVRLFELSLTGKLRNKTKQRSGFQALLPKAL